MGNHLHGGAKVFAPALLIQHIPVHLAGGEVGVFVQILINEALIVSQVQIGLGAVFGDIDLSVLIRAHGAGVHVDIGVQLLCRDLQSPGLQQPAQRRGSNALAKTGHHAAGNENILCHVCSLRIFRDLYKIFIAH